MTSDRIEPLSTRAELTVKKRFHTSWLSNPAVILFWVTVASAAVFYFQIIATSPGAITARLSIDDSFYYFQTAWQSVQSGFVTFDGIHETNGIHFLWFLVVYGLALVSPDKLFLLHAAYLTALAIALLTYALIWRAGTLLQDKQRYLTALLALLWTAVLAGKRHQMFVGMESTLHMATLWLALITFLKINEEITTREISKKFSLLLLTASLILVTWSRIDSAIYASIIFIIVVFIVIFRRTESVSGYIKLFLPCILLISFCAATQIGFYAWSAGTLIPISGLIKSAAPHETIAEMLKAYAGILFPFGQFVFSERAWFLLLGVSFFALLLIYTVRCAVTSPVPLRWLHQFAAALGVGAILHALVLCLHHDPITRWYLAPIYLFYISAIATFIADKCAKVPQHARTSTIPSVIILLLIYVSSIGGFLNSYRPIAIYFARYQLGEKLEKVTKEEEVVASFNAGQLGYFSNRIVINLDGLVNDDIYRRNILGKNRYLLEYLKNNNVTYVVDYDFYWATAEIRANSTEIFRYPVLGSDRRVLSFRRMQYD